MSRSGPPRQYCSWCCRREELKQEDMEGIGQEMGEADATNEDFVNDEVSLLGFRMRKKLGALPRC
jgi:hypothetical protein